jgi:hypothetical protein
MAYWLFSQIESLMEDTLTCGAVTEECEAHIAGAQVFLGEGQAGTGSYLGTDDAVAAEEALLGAEEVHTSPFPLGASGSLAV